jgi:hypothetical protein
MMAFCEAEPGFDIIIIHNSFNAKLLCKRVPVLLSVGSFGSRRG